MTAKLGAIATRFENIEGQMTEITSYWLQSTKNPSKTKFLDSIVKTITAKIVPLEDLSKMWQESAFSLGIYFGKERASGGLSYTPWMISTGGNNQKNVWLRYPSFALSSNFKTSTRLGPSLNRRQLCKLLIL